MKDCLFCKILNGDIPSLKLYENDLVYVMLDAFPDSDGHTLIIPKKHYETINEVDDETLLHMFKIAREQTNILMDKLDKNALTYLINFGESQVIKHLHLHLIPNFKSKTSLSKEEVYNILKG